MNFFVNFNEIFIDKRIVSGKMELRVELMNNFKGRIDSRNDANGRGRRKAISDLH